ncbi:hypothetical protein SAMN04488587_1736 [Methanococcoides vulcani]|uniref:Uncharacterized protein n=1 Tax=Methanococcoides vulcani TaxID=1353158 RepID=A0A1I0APS7_9EURY|nr:hypothetical protein [Methanococcoides vulcani]SES96184.1 hypothetical protein SAMN04488587_1736 [Methanococcoides vulcani]
MKTVTMRSALILTLAIVFIMSVATISSAFTWTNNIVLEEDGMTWDYTEGYNGEVAISYRGFIDSEVGNDDDHVSAWELMKVDYFTRNRLKTTLMEELDVAFDSSSEDVHVTDVDAEISLDVLGSTSKTANITNMYFVTYSFDRNFFDMGNSMTFEGQADTEVNITMPSGAKLLSYDGIKIKTIDTKDNRTAINGFFEEEGKITIDFTRDEAQTEVETEADEVPE